MAFKRKDMTVEAALAFAMAVYLRLTLAPTTTGAVRRADEISLVNPFPKRLDPMLRANARIVR